MLKKCLEKRRETKQIKTALVSSKWIGSRIDMPGLQCLALDKFGSNLVIVFDKSGTGTLEIKDDKTKHRWKIKGDKLFTKGPGLNTYAFLQLDDLNGDYAFFHLMDIEGYSVAFYSE